MTGPRLCLPIMLALALTGCKREDMVTQNKDVTWGQSAFLRGNRTMQPPPPGSIARNGASEAAPQPAEATPAMMARGHETFDIYCSPCHGRVGDGAGPIVQRGFPHPPSLLTDPLRSAKAQHYYDVITNGHGKMYSYADRVAPADRWAVIAYIRALQLSQDAAVASLPQAYRAQLAGAAAP